MSQASTKRLDWYRYVRTLAFRAGYEDARSGKPPSFGKWPRYELAYEDGRLVAAFLGTAAQPLARSIPDPDALALMMTVLEVQPRRRVAA